MSIGLSLLPHPLTLNDTGFRTLTKNGFFKPLICIGSINKKVFFVNVILSY